MTSQLMLKRLAEVSTNIRDLMAQIETDAGIPQALPGSMELIQKRVSEIHDITISELVGRCRRAEFVRARHLAMFLCKAQGRTLKAVALAFCGRDHGTVIHACKRVEELISIKDAATMAALEKLKPTDQTK